jgi:nicotinic acid mononucleotide adenylyltransferase
MERVNIIIGRFQPFTIGHLKCAHEAWRKLGVKTVLLVIETIKQDERHPFLTKQIARILDKTCKDEDSLTGYLLVKNADIVKNIEILRGAGYEPVSWTCGTDRYASYNTMVERYGKDINLVDDFEVIEVKRTDDDVSATAARNALRSDNEHAFVEIVPDVWKKQFHYLRKIIMTVNEDAGNQNRYKSLQEYLIECMSL